jgi:hypothetical protein
MIFFTIPQNTHGWFGGGSSSSTVDRITFASDTGTAPARGPLSLARSALIATGNDNFGWFGGGFSSNLDRIDFASDSSISSVRGQLNASKYTLAATGGIIQ